MADDSIIRWLHLSDFHVGKDKYAQRRIFKRIHEHVRERVEAEAPDLVFITGDLAQSGKSEEYAELYGAFLLPLRRDVLGAGWDGKIFTIPGNHDVDRSVARYGDREKMCQPAEKILDGSEEGLREREIHLLPRFRAYAESETREGSDSQDGWLTSTAGAFGELLEVRGRKLGIVGVNTAWLCKDEHDRHRLTPGLALLEDALAAVRGCDACIVLGHHPLDWFHDPHLEPVRALLGAYGALYLHGHLHEHRGRPEDGAGRGFLAIQSGACFQARDGEPWVNGLLWAEL
ncbi:MAG: metallophosphoesterase, partial [bacterium]|nr:metallophosphoesterase [bacterium]